jgi:hypothetical protein
VATKFGALSKLDFLQDWASMLIARINPAIVHNLEKYAILRKVHYLSAIEDIAGDYLEFGVYSGSSFSHSIRCCRSLRHLNPNVSMTRFFGFDSFAGFGSVPEADKHPFYTDINFTTSFEKVNRRVSRAAKGAEFRLVPGFFSESLSAGPQTYGITKARVIFVDSDTYSSADQALRFCEPVVQPGTFIVLDDYFAYRGSADRGVAKAFSEFQTRAGISVRSVFSYGMGGVVYVVSSVPK